MPRVYVRQPVIERFMSRVHIEPNSGCWLWAGATFNGIDNGYGQFGVDGKNWQAHRWSWTHHRGPIPDGLCVCHHCDNPSCVNPEHMFVATNVENTRDRNRKGRQAHNRGERAGGVKWTEAQVRDVKRRYRAGERQADIMRAVGMTRQHVSSICLGHRWGHVTP